MAFRSLFVGTNRYKSSLIPNLSGCVNGARALHGLFADAFGERNSILCTDEQATRAAIIASLHQLHRTDPDDVVVIGFSGHGSGSPPLVTSDADPLRLDTTAIHLDELTDLFSGIPARHLLLLLDCCFAGGAGG